MRPSPNPPHPHCAFSPGSLAGSDGPSFVAAVAGTDPGPRQDFLRPGDIVILSPTLVKEAAEHAIGQDGAGQGLYTETSSLPATANPEPERPPHALWPQVHHPASTDREAGNDDCDVSQNCHGSTLPAHPPSVTLQGSSGAEGEAESHGWKGEMGQGNGLGTEGHT